mmetsp:Transcript_4221/g.10886  ORF Transcript_4221/g.10886 Transcript_4221/m.10886 type:complete len:294 (+) Transcript_4221:619-1500(+)
MKCALPMAGAAKVTSVGRRRRCGVLDRAACTAPSCASAPPSEWPVKSTRPPRGSACAMMESRSSEIDSNAFTMPRWQCACSREAAEARAGICEPGPTRSPPPLSPPAPYPPPPPRARYRAGSTSMSVSTSLSSFVPRNATVTRPSAAGPGAPDEPARVGRARHEMTQHTRGERIVCVTCTRGASNPAPAADGSTAPSAGVHGGGAGRIARSTSHCCRTHGEPTTTTSPRVAFRLYGARLSSIAPCTSCGHILRSSSACTRRGSHLCVAHAGGTESALPVYGTVCLAASASVGG